MNRSRARVGEGLARDGGQGVFGQRFELEDAAAADQRPVDAEIGVFGGRANQDDGAVFHPGQKGVLLGLVEAVYLVDEEDGSGRTCPAAAGPPRWRRGCP